MNISKNIKYLNFILLFILIISIFFIPQLILICKTKKKLNQMNISLNNYNNQRKELNTKFEDSKNFSIKLQKDKDEQLIKIKELLKMYSYYSLSNEEKKNDYYITDRKNYIMEKLIKLYEKNKLPSHN